MKRLLFLCSCFLCASLLAESDILNLNPVQTEARKLLSEQSTAQPGQAFDVQQLKELHRAIVGNRPNVWAMPEPMLRGIQDELEPLRAQAKQLAESTLPDERYYGAILNSYLRQTEETRALLLKLARDDRPETAGTAMDTLFGLKLDTPELRAELVTALQEDKPPRERGTMYAMAKSNIGDWGIVEAVPTLIKLLERSEADGKPIDRGLIRQIKALGPGAAEALPLLRRLTEKRRAAGNADFRELEDLEYAVLVVSGEYKAPRQESPTQSSQVSTPPETPSPSLRKAPDIQPLPTTPAEESPVSPRWPLVAAVVVAALGLLWVLLKKRK